MSVSRQARAAIGCPSIERPNHNQIPLRIVPELKHMLTYFGEPMFPAKSDRPWVVLPNRQPRAACTALCNQLEAFVHKCLRNTRVVKLIQHV